MNKRTLAAILLLTFVTLSVIACGSSGADGHPEVRRKAEDRLHSCPKRETDRRENANPFADRTLVPPGARSALICRYQGRRVAGPRPAPQAETLGSNSARFQRLTHAFEQLDPVQRGTVACPTGSPLRYLVAFHYASQNDNYIRVDFNGCGVVTNEALETMFVPSEMLRRALRGAK